MIKKITTIIITAGLMLTLSMSCLAAPAAVAASSNVPTVRVNDQLVSFPDVQPFVDTNNRTLLPVRFVAEAMGADVQWDQSSSTAMISQDGVIVKLPIGSKTITVLKNGMTSTVTTMDTQAVAKNGRTFVPIRFVAEALGAYVGWSSYYNVVEICKDKLSRDDIIRLRGYGYVFYLGSRYILDSKGNPMANTDNLKFYATLEINNSFLDKTNGYDNAREFLLRYKTTSNYKVTAKLTNKTWLFCDDNQAPLYLAEAIALVNKSYSAAGITADFTADTSCVYQDSLYDGSDYSIKGILNMTVTDQSSENVQKVLSGLHIPYVSGQTKYTIDFETKVGGTMGNTVVIANSYNLSNGRK